jgi:hypothetical protein
VSLYNRENTVLFSAKCSLWQISEFDKMLLYVSYQNHFTCRGDMDGG